MTFQERFGRLSWKRRHEAVVRVGQVHRQVVRLLFHAGDHHQSFAEIRLRLARTMRQRNEHLPAVQLFATYVILHDGVAAAETVLFSKPVEDPLGRMPLLGRPLLVVVQDGVNDAYSRPKLRPPDRLLSLVAWWNSVLQHLPNRLSRKTKLPGHRTLTPALDTNSPTYTPVYLHLEHPSGVPQASPSRQMQAKPESGGAYFYSAAKHRLRGALWPIFTPALIYALRTCPFGSIQCDWQAR